MIKKIRLVIFILIFSVIFTGCSAANGDKKQESTNEENQPDISKIRDICQLATLECFYHNVAKSVKTKGTGLIHIGEKDRTFWIEYTGTAKIGVDMSEVKLDVKDDNVNVYIPEAKLMSCKVEEITKDSFIVSSDSWFNKNSISGDEQTKAVEQAQIEMKSSVENNKALLIRAQERAKTLIENYIKHLGEMFNISYKISWKYGEIQTTIKETESEKQ